MDVFIVNTGRKINDPVSVAGSSEIQDFTRFFKPFGFAGEIILNIT